MRFSEPLRKSQDFSRVYREGTSYANKYLIMYILPNGTDQNRFGVSVSKKVGNSVVRHRMKRLLKENYRLKEEQFRCGLDIVVIVRESAVGKTYDEIGSALLHLGRLHKIIDQTMGEST